MFKFEMGTMTKRIAVLFLQNLLRNPSLPFGWRPTGIIFSSQRTRHLEAVLLSKYAAMDEFDVHTEPK